MYRCWNCGLNIGDNGTPDPDEPSKLCPACAKAMGKVKNEKGEDNER